MAPTERRLDARGLRCPLPVLRMERALAEARTGERLRVLATDPVARIDIPLYCRRNGHAVELTLAGEVLDFLIVKGGG